MAEATRRSEIQLEMANDMNQTDLASQTETTPQQMVEQQQVEDKVTVDLEKMIQNCGDGILSPDCCIYRVPITIRDLNEDAYAPTVVSIGPFHHGEEKLQDMEIHKQILFKRFTQRAKSNLVNLEDLVCCVKLLEPRIRASYSETINHNEQELLKLALTDAGFIIEFSIMFYEISMGKKGNGDAKLSQPSFVNSIFYDLLLLENQLPFFVMEDLFNKAFPHGRRGSLPSFLRLACLAFDNYGENLAAPNSDVKIKHVLDLVRLMYLQGKKSERYSFSEDRSHVLLYNAHSLQEAGVKLKASMSNCLLDLKFTGRVLEIPQILVEDKTEALFRNMIAFEQCHYPCDSYITDYALVLDRLIDTYKDVDLLVDKKIVSHSLGDSNNVALLFNGLCKNVTQMNLSSEYIDICQRLNSYCQDPMHRLKATLRRDYCNTPWRTVASIAGIILLVLTIIQTIFSVLQVVL